MRSHKIFNILPLSPSLQNILTRELKISGVLAQLLINRGIKDSQEAEEFLNAELDSLLDPYGFPDMRMAVGLIKKAAVSKGEIMICGDYDADGITALALLKSTLVQQGVNPSHYIPHRVKDGYGLNKKAVQIAKQKNIKLLITVDCGTNSRDEIEELRRNDIDVIVTDHHESGNCDLAPASAMINSKLKDCPYKYKGLAGVGAAYKLCQALTGNKLFEDLDLVSLGTIADVVPLTGENRIIVKQGLVRLSQAKRVGIKALIEVSRMKARQINSTFVSFILAPRINASGRMDTAETALNLLMSEKKEQADELAGCLDAYNRQRQKIESKIMEEARDVIAKEVNFKEHKVIVIAKEGWHQGVLGIVAAKLADKFYRPVIVISLSGDLCKGSGRSIKNFHLFHALLECREFLKTFGGHSHAVGLAVDKHSIGDFKDKINHFAREKLTVEDLLPSVDVDMELSMLNVSKELAYEIKRMEPFGTGNPEPLFYTRNLKLKGQPYVLSRDTLKFWVTDGTVTHPVIGFGMGSFKDNLIHSESFDLVYSLGIDNWQGADSLILEVKDISFK